MAKDKKKNSKPIGYLIDVLPDNIKEILKEGRLYREFQLARLKALEGEVAQKQKVLELIRAAELKPIKGNIIAFEYEDFEFSVEPRDELLKVRKKKPKTSEI